MYSTLLVYATVDQYMVHWPWNRILTQQVHALKTNKPAPNLRNSVFRGFTNCKQLPELLLVHGVTNT